jgi:phage terminase Nu1 subunit (DNA packaging protein)
MPLNLRTPAHVARWLTLMPSRKNGKGSVARYAPECFGVPKRAAARFPHLAPQDVQVLDAEVRAVFTEFADMNIEASEAIAALEENS